MNNLVIQGVILGIILLAVIVRAIKLKPIMSSIKECLLIFVVSVAATFLIFKVDFPFRGFFFILFILNFYAYYFGLKKLFKSINDLMFRSAVILHSSEDAINFLIERGAEFSEEEFGISLVSYDNVYYWLTEQGIAISLSGYPPPSEDEVLIEFVEANEIIEIGSRFFKVVEDGDIIRLEEQKVSDEFHNF